MIGNTVFVYFKSILSRSTFLGNLSYLISEYNEIRLSISIYVLSGHVQILISQVLQKLRTQNVFLVWRDSKEYKINVGYGNMKCLANEKTHVQIHFLPYLRVSVLSHKHDE